MTVQRLSGLTTGSDLAASDNNPSTIPRARHVPRVVPFIQNAHSHTNLHSRQRVTDCKHSRRSKNHMEKKIISCGSVRMRSPSSIPRRFGALLEPFLPPRRRSCRVELSLGVRQVARHTRKGCPHLGLPGFVEQPWGCERCRRDAESCCGRAHRLPPWRWCPPPKPFLWVGEYGPPRCSESI